MKWDDTKYRDDVTAWWSYKLLHAQNQVGFFAPNEWKRVKTELPYFIEAYEGDISLTLLRERCMVAASCPSTMTYCLCRHLNNVLIGRTDQEKLEYVKTLLGVE